MTKIQINEKYEGVEEEVFVCLRRIVLLRIVDLFVMLSTEEGVKVVLGHLPPRTSGAKAEISRSSGGSSARNFQSALS